MIRPILLLSFFIAFTANNIAQEQQYRIWFNDKPESVHSVDEPAKFLSEQVIAHREKQNIPIDSTDLPIDPVRLKKLSELGARILATSKWLNTATITLTDTTDLSAIASLSFVKKHESLGVAVQPVSNLKKRQKQIESESENPYGRPANRGTQRGRITSSRIHWKRNDNRRHRWRILQRRSQSQVRPK